MRARTHTHTHLDFIAVWRPQHLQAAVRAQSLARGALACARVARVRVCVRASLLRAGCDACGGAHQPDTHHAATRLRWGVRGGGAPDATRGQALSTLPSARTPTSSVCAAGMLRPRAGCMLKPVAATERVTGGMTAFHACLHASEKRANKKKNESEKRNCPGLEASRFEGQE